MNYNSIIHFLNFGTFQQRNSTDQVIQQVNVEGHI
jgi:hypothetical protein